MTDVIDSLAGRLIVSCQAYPGEPLRDPDILTRMALSVESAGASAVRAEGIETISVMSDTVQVPVIGLIKSGHGDVFITPTLAHARAVVDAGADVVALDATPRPRPGDENVPEIVNALRQRRDVTVLGDITDVQAAVFAFDAGVDVVATTLAPPVDEGPDLELVAAIVALGRGPVIVEGHVWTPEHAAAALAAGAHAVVVGSAITHPARITARFLRAIAPPGHRD